MHFSTGVALGAHNACCLSAIASCLRLALLIDDWRRAVKARGIRLAGSLRKMLRGFLLQNDVVEPPPIRRRAHNRTPPDVEDAVVAVHVDHPHLGTGQLQYILARTHGRSPSRETLRKILIRRESDIEALELARGRQRRRIEVDGPRELWGIDLTLVWILGFFPAWVLGIVDYHGSRLMAVQRLHYPTAPQIALVLQRAIAKHGPPKRIISDRATVFRAQPFQNVLRANGVTHTLTRPYHPWSNGRIERFFGTYKQMLRSFFWVLRSTHQLDRVNRDVLVLYNRDRPHRSYRGKTPDEVYFGRPLRKGHSGKATYFDGRLSWWRLG